MRPHLSIVHEPAGWLPQSSMRALPADRRAPLCRSWNHYGCGISEQLIRNQTDAFKKYLAPAGYEYLNLDECAARSPLFLLASARLLTARARCAAAGWR